MNETQLTERELAELRVRARELDEREPRIAAFEVVEGDQVMLRFQLRGNAVAGATLSFPASQIPGLENASAIQLRGAIISSSGSSIRWPELDFGIGAPVLVGFACGLCDADWDARLRRFDAVRRQNQGAARDANQTSARRETARRETARL